jgi:large subunit ribosomal protein L20
MHGMKLAGIELDRKILADLAAQEPSSFSRLCDDARSAVEKAA